ncbi:MAG: pilus assembly protein TadG-related protein [Tepidisphaeraceae bacterium]
MRRTSHSRVRRCQGIGRRRGVTLVYATACLGTLILFSALGVDLFRARIAKAELQAACDAAAMNAANGLADSTYVVKASAAAAENKCDNTAITLASSAVVPGYYNNGTFTANGTPRNAVRVTLRRTVNAAGSLRNTIAETIGLTSPDFSVTTTVALVNQADYEWVGLNSVSITAPTGGCDIVSYDSANASAPWGTTTVKSNGAINISGPINLQADLKYGTSYSVTGSPTWNGAATQSGTPLTYPTGAQVANLSGVVPVYSATTDLNVSGSMTLAGGTYVVKNLNLTNADITFTGPATIVLTGNLNFTTSALRSCGSLPANLKIISTTTAPNTIKIDRPTAILNADFYAPGSDFTFTGASGYQYMKGRGLFKSITTTGTTTCMWYDRQLTSSSLSKKAVVVK